MPPAKKTSSAQNTTLQSMGMDVIKQYPGPLTVSRAVKRSRASTLPAPHRRGAERVVHGHGRRVHGAAHVRAARQGLGRRAHWARHPLHLRDSDAIDDPSSGSAGPSTSGHAADPPSADPLGGADMSLLQRAGVLQNTPYDA